nr:MAG TPA: hypothetical protein [Caudoviricetes sp.]
MSSSQLLLITLSSFHIMSHIKLLFFRGSLPRSSLKTVS